MNKTPAKYGIFYGDGALLATYHRYPDLKKHWALISDAATRGFYLAALNAVPGRVSRTWSYSPAYKLDLGI